MSKQDKSQILCLRWGRHQDIICHQWLNTKKHIFSVKTLKGSAETEMLKSILG